MWVDHYDTTFLHIACPLDRNPFMSSAQLWDRLWHYILLDTSQGYKKQKVTHQLTNDQNTLQRSCVHETATSPDIPHHLYPTGSEKMAISWLAPSRACDKGQNVWRSCHKPIWIKHHNNSKTFKKMSTRQGSSFECPIVSEVQDFSKSILTILKTSISKQRWLWVRKKCLVEEIISMRSWKGFCEILQQNLLEAARVWPGVGQRLFRNAFLSWRLFNIKGKESADHEIDHSTMYA